MNSRRIGRGMAAVALIASAACNSLDIQNPNAPDNKRILSDPDAVEAVAAGAIRTWFNAYETNRGAGPLTTAARTMSASWNNDHMRFYSSVDNPGNPATTGYTPTATWYRQNEGYWANDPTRPERVEIESFWVGSEDECCVGNAWPGFFAGLSSANDALGAIRNGNIVIRTPGDTKRAETIAELGRGLALMGIALNYDKGYIIDENTDVANLTYSDRKAMRNAAVDALKQVMADAGANSFVTDAKWTNGRSYSSGQIKQLAATLAAMTMAYYPRDATEMAAVPWDSVASFAAQGISSGTRFDFEVVADGCAAWCPDHLAWFDEVGTGRINTRVAHLLDPATQADPWPLTGNPQPHSADARLGDGTFGDGTLSGGSETIAKDAGAGTDFAWGKAAIYRPDRGAYHQSNIAMIKFDRSGTEAGTGIILGYGPVIAISSQQNDLIWAEALLRKSSPDVTKATQLINLTRVGRGKLPAAGGEAVGADTDGPCMSTNVTYRTGAACSLWAKLLYEKEVEILGLGPSPFYEQRRLPFITTCTAPVAVPAPGSITCNGKHVAGLLPGTPREMPVPAKELQVKGEALYTFGGAGAAKSPVP